MNKKRVIWVTNPKGGVGKSMTASILVDYYLQSHRPLIVEADGSVPDVGRRYDKVVPGVLASICGDDPVNALYGLLEKIEGKATDEKFDRIVVNLPANSSVIEDVADEILAVTNALGIENNTVFVIAEGDDSATLCAQSCELGICSISRRKVAVVNGHFGRTPDRFAWFSSVAREAWLASGNAELFLPNLHRRVRELPEIQLGRLSAYTSPGLHGVSLVNQMVLRKFVKAGFAIGDALEDVDSEELVK